MSKLLITGVAAAFALVACAGQNIGAIKTASAETAVTSLAPAAASKSYVVLTTSCPQEQKAGGQKNLAFFAPLLIAAAPFIVEGVKQGVKYLYNTGVTWLKEREIKYSARSAATTDQDYAFYQTGSDKYIEPALGCIIFYRGKPGGKPIQVQKGRVDHFSGGAYIELYAEFKVESALTVEWFPIKGDAKSKKDWPVTMRLRPLVLEYLEGGTELGKNEEKQIVFDVSIKKAAGLTSGGTITSAVFDFGKITPGPSSVQAKANGILGPSPAFVPPAPTIVKLSVPQLDSATQKTTMVEIPFVDPVGIEVSVSATEVGKGGQVEKFIGGQLEENRDKVLKPFNDWLEKAVDAYVEQQKKQP